jgi:hypothetical protein
MANRGLGWHQDAGTFNAWFTDLVDTLVASPTARVGATYRLGLKVVPI